MTRRAGRRVPPRVGLVVGLVAALAGIAHGQALQIGQPAPGLAGGPWINSQPLDAQGVRGRVVLVDFWTYG